MEMELGMDWTYWKGSGEPNQIDSRGSWGPTTQATAGIFVEKAPRVVLLMKDEGVTAGGEVEEVSEVPTTHLRRDDDAWT
jgi:hypothetical protein